MQADYRPLHAERSCLICGRWRGQHNGESVNDKEMRCPVDPALPAWYEVDATFVPNPRSV